MDGSSQCRLWQELGDISQISNWKTLWQECADWALPRKDNVLKVNIEGLEKPVQRLIDTCIEANYNFATGFFSRMFPAGNIWGKFKHPDPEVNADELVAEYFELVSREIHSILTESNFTQEIQESLTDIGCFGTNCIYLEEDDDDVVAFRSFPVSDIRIGLNHKGRVDTVGREIQLNSRQMVQKFGEEALKEAGLDQIMAQVAMQKTEKYTVYHLVFPRSDYKAMATDSKNKRFASVYTASKTKKILREGGHDLLPYFIGRFTTGNNDTYGTSPQMNILGTTRRSNAIKRSLIAVAELNAGPQWVIPDDDSVQGLSNRANAIIRYRNVAPQRLDSNGNPALANEIYEAHDEEIKRAYFNHLFRPLDEYRNMTAYEVQQRQSTDLMSLTPFASRYYDEVVTPMLTLVYKMAQKSGRLPDMPPMLRENPNFKIEYVGQLSLATMSFETSGMFSTMNMFAEISQYVPAAQAVFQNIDFDKALRTTWYNQNASMQSLRPQDEVDEERAAQAAAQQQQQQQQAVMDGAQAYSMGTKAPEEGSASQAGMQQIGG
jgi:hypothetical protein